MPDRPAPEITVHGYPSALNVQKVLWLLEEMGTPFRHVPVGGGAARRTSDAAFLALNPHGLVPVVEIGGRHIWESHAILRCLAALYGGEALWPADPVERAGIEMWMDWSQTVLEFDLNLDFYWAFAEGEGDDPARFEAARAKVAPLLERLEARLSEAPFLSGARFGLADIATGILIHRYASMPVRRPDLPRLADWHARIAARPAFRARVAAPGAA